MKTYKAISLTYRMLLGAFFVVAILSPLRLAHSDEYRRDMRFEHKRMEEERLRRIEEERRLEAERRWHPVAVYAPAPVVVAPPRPLPALAL